MAKPKKSFFKEQKSKEFYNSSKQRQLFGKSQPMAKVQKETIEPKSASVTYEMLSDEQKLGLDKVESFMSSCERQMVLAGYAGTGKSTLTRFILDYLDKKSYKTVCTAPTNEAVRVISKHTGRKYQMTIYSILGLALCQDDDSTPTLKSVGESKLKDYDVVIVDECSMINSSLFAMIDHMLKQFSHVKIIYVGDHAQLPPVNDPNGISPVFMLNPENWAQLTTVQRTAADNPIIGLVTPIRMNLSSPIDAFPKLTNINTEKDIGVEFLSDRDTFMNRMFDLFKSQEFKDDPNHVRSLAYTNKAVDAMNIHIRRAIYGPEVGEFCEGEVVLVDEPIMDEYGQYVQYTVGERLRIDRVELKDDIVHGLKYWQLEVENYEAPSYNRSRRNIDVVHCNYVEVFRTALTAEAQMAKRKLIETGSKKEAWRAYFKFKNRFSWVKYLYAITVHTSQGSTFKNVFVVNADLDKLRWNHMERNKLKYVAFTRASHRLVIY